MSNGATNDAAVTAQEAQERAVGISVFVRPDVPGFSCVVKQRYTDFLVNEILPNGQVLHLSEVSSGNERKRKRANDGDASQKKQRAEDERQAAPAAEQETEVKDEAMPDVAAATITPEPREATSDASLQAVKEEAIASIIAEDKATLKDVFGDHTTSSILNLYAAVVAHPDRKARDHNTVKSQPIQEKSKRTEAHMCIRRIFSSKLETLTVQDQNNQSGPGTIISIKASPPKTVGTPMVDNRNGGEGQRGKQNWADLGGEYLHFTLYKENKDTMEVLYFIASQMKMHMKHFSFAGTKDRRGVTVQRVAIHRVRRERIEALNRMARGWRLGGPWEYRPDALELGMLSGNEFLLTLRDAGFPGMEAGWDMERKLQHAKQAAETAAKSLSTSGYLNYYGLQRFGTHSTGTHTIGMKMLKGNLKGAVDSILSYDHSLVEENQPPTSGAGAGAANGNHKKVPQDDVSRATAIHGFITTGNSSEALSRMPGRFSAEKGMITHLGKRDRKTGKKPNENDYQGALMSIQRNLRLMYVHAYQSYVWNTVVGKRWESFGEKVVEGDLVVVGEKEQAEGVPNGNGTLADEVDEDGEPIIHPSATDGEEPDQSRAPAGSTDNDPFTRARPLSRAEAESGRFSILDLVLPLPGFDVIYPNNKIGKFYEEFMASEAGGELDPHKMRRAWKDISLSGGYRKIMSRPIGNGIEVDVRAYSGLDEQMVETDLEKLEKSGKDEHDAVNGAAGEKDKIAVILKLQLGSSQYATMALRELTKAGAHGYITEFSAPKR